MGRPRLCDNNDGYQKNITAVIVVYAFVAPTVCTSDADWNALVEVPAIRAHCTFRREEER